MLCGYSDFDPTHNWLHEVLVVVVSRVHESIDRGEEPTWPEVLPMERREKLRSKNGLEDRVKRYYQELKRHPIDVRQRVLRLLTEQNDIASLLSRRSECEHGAVLPGPVAKIAGDLFKFGYYLLTTLGTRDDHYRAVTARLRRPVCPCCGIHYLVAPLALDHDPAEENPRREELDHYLAKTLYPFAAANLRNLPPICGRCNSTKLGKDILHTPTGARRHAFDPYSPIHLMVSLANSVPFARKKLPTWDIDFSSVLVVSENETEAWQERVATWDEVYGVRKRYAIDVLDQWFNPWVDSFGRWVRNKRRRATLSDSITENLRVYCEELELFDNGGPEFLKLPTFRWLYARCLGGDQRLKDFLQDAVPP